MLCYGCCLQPCRCPPAASTVMLGAGGGLPPTPPMLYHTTPGVLKEPLYLLSLWQYLFLHLGLRTVHLGMETRVGSLGLVLVSPHSPLPTHGCLRSRRETPPPAFRMSHFMQLLCLCPFSLSHVPPRRQPQAGRRPALPWELQEQGLPQGRRGTNHGAADGGMAGTSWQLRAGLTAFSCSRKVQLLSPWGAGSSSAKFVVSRSDQPFWACPY